MNKWSDYGKVSGILLLGFSSGLPFLLTLGTLHAWLKLSGVSNTVIGYFAIATIPYMFKFLWAPFTDHVRIPLLTSLMGQRRAWILSSQIALSFSLCLLGLTNPQDNILLTGLATFGVSFFASCQDNGIEAYRIEALPRDFLGPGASASVLGFRIGMWVSGGGALYLSYLTNDWSIVYGLMALCVGIGMMATLLLPNPSTHHSQSVDKVHLEYPVTIHKNILHVLREFSQRKDFYAVVVFIFLFKIGDTVLNMISIPFLIEIGFTDLEIANIAKTFGIFAMILGGIFGGMLQMRQTAIFNLTLSTSLMVLSCIMFMIQAHLGHNTHFLIMTMGLENFACGISATALISYLSTLCQQPNTATHFAILSSFCSFSRIGLSIGAGWLADHTDWVSYFAIIASLSMMTLIWISIFGQQIISVYNSENSLAVQRR
ncbi:MAG: MFS transporter [Alphaproteobacteria bacterium]|nr:MFS transporter [Alphaproteobacteria bacterium]